METLAEKRAWKLQCSRNTFVHLTMVLEETFAQAAPLLKDADIRGAGFDAIEKLQAARDGMMAFINALEGVEYQK